MRKSLLAGAAIAAVSFGMSGVASAQAVPPAPTQGKLVTQLNGGRTSAFDNNSAGPKALRGPIANPTPGTMVIRLNARVMTDMTFSWGDTEQSATNKYQPFGIRQYMRLYPAMDAMAANGLRYGGAIELRENDGSIVGTTSSSGGSSYSTTRTVFVRRSFVYVAGDNWGYVRIGSADGLIGVYDGGGKTTGVFLSPTGTIVGGDLQGASEGRYPWMVPYFGAQSGNEYVPTKIVYLSPQFAGFDFGLQYQPNSFNGYASGARLSSTTNPLNGAGYPGSRARNQYAVGARYTGAFGGAKMFAYAIYEGSGHVNYNGAPVANPATGGTFSGQFENLSIGMFGANVEYAGVSVFGNVLFGAVNGTLGLKPSGAPDAIGWGAGVKYANGPYTIGALYTQYNSAGRHQPDGLFPASCERHLRGGDLFAGSRHDSVCRLCLWVEAPGWLRLRGRGNPYGPNHNTIHSQGFDVGVNLGW